jgi:hypothetical protein
MKKRFLFLLTCAFLLSACLPAFSQPTVPNTTTPISEVDLQLTAAVLSEQTLQALPTHTSIPSEPPVVITATQTVTATETQNSFLLTLTATLGTGTVTTDGVSGTVSANTIIGTLPFTGTPNVTSNPLTTTATIEPNPQAVGTLPPNLPFGFVSLINKSKADAYISLRCVTKDGYVTILEFPVGNTVDSKSPAGKYTYVAWVGGRQFTGSFSLSKGDDVIITLFKDKITIK